MKATLNTNFLDVDREEWNDVLTAEELITVLRTFHRGVVGEVTGIEVEVDEHDMTANYYNFTIAGVDIVGLAGIHINGIEGYVRPLEGASNETPAELRFGVAVRVSDYAPGRFNHDGLAAHMENALQQALVLWEQAHRDGVSLTSVEFETAVEA